MSVGNECETECLTKVKILVKILVNLNNSGTGPERAVKLEIGEESTILEMINLALKSADMFEQFRCIDAKFLDKDFNEFINVEPKSKIQEKCVYKLIVEKNEHVDINQSNSSSYQDGGFRLRKTYGSMNNNNNSITTEDPEVEYALALRLLDNPADILSKNKSNLVRRKTLIAKKPPLLSTPPVDISNARIQMPRNGPVVLPSARGPLLNLPLSTKKLGLLDRYSTTTTPPPSMEQMSASYVQSPSEKLPFNGPSNITIEKNSKQQKLAISRTTTTNIQKLINMTETTEKIGNIWLVGNVGGNEEWTIKQKSTTTDNETIAKSNFAEQKEFSQKMPYLNLYESTLQPEPPKKQISSSYQTTTTTIDEQKLYTNDQSIMSFYNFFQQQQNSPEKLPNIQSTTTTTNSLISSKPYRKRAPGTKKNSRSSGHKKKHDAYLLSKGIIPNSMKFMSDEEKRKKIDELKDYINSEKPSSSNFIAFVPPSQ